MKITRVPFTQMRNNEHFQAQTEIKKLIEEFDADRLKINPLFSDVYVPRYHAEDVALIKISKNSITELRSDADRTRDFTFRGTADTVNSCLYHFNPEIQEAARRVKIVFNTFGNVAQLPLSEETSAIYNLVQELFENHSVNIAKIGIVTWLNKLKADNEAYEALAKVSYEEDAAKTELKAKTTRIEVDKALRQIIERIEALIVIEGEADYAEFVRRLNLQLDKYVNTIAQRKGAAKARQKR